MRYFKLKMRRMRLAARTRWGAYSAPPDLLAGYKGRGMRREGKGKGKGRRDREGRKGRGGDKRREKMVNGGQRRGRGKGRKEDEGER